MIQRCPDARALLPAFLEGELTALEHDRVAGHLAICASCRREERTFRAALGLLNQPAVREPVHPGDLYPGFAAKLEATQRRSAGRRLQLQWAAGMACLALVAAVGASTVGRLVQSTTTAQPTIGVGYAGTTAPYHTANRNLDSVRGLVHQAPPAIVPPSVQQYPAPTVPTQAENQIAQHGPTAVSDSQPDSDARLRKPSLRGERKRIAFNSFLDIQPEHGNSARDQYARLNKQNRANNPESLHTGVDSRMAANAGEAYVPVRKERVQVGSVVTEVQTGYETDADGRRKGIEVNIGTFIASEKKE